jgi:hypothetical protein
VVLGAGTLGAAPGAPPVPAAAARDASLPLADDDPNNDFVVAPPDALENCEEELTRRGVRFTHASLPLQRGRGGVPAAADGVRRQGTVPCARNTTTVAFHDG